MIQVQIQPVGPYKFSPSLLIVPLLGSTEGCHSQLSWLPHPGKKSFWAGWGDTAPAKVLYGIGSHGLKNAPLNQSLRKGGGIG